MELERQLGGAAGELIEGPGLGTPPGRGVEAVRRAVARRERLAARDLAWLHVPAVQVIGDAVQPCLVEPRVGDLQLASPPAPYCRYHPPMATADPRGSGMRR